MRQPRKEQSLKTGLPKGEQRQRGTGAESDTIATDNFSTLMSDTNYSSANLREGKQSKCVNARNLGPKHVISKLEKVKEKSNCEKPERFQKYFLSREAKIRILSESSESSKACFSACAPVSTGCYQYLSLEA